MRFAAAVGGLTTNGPHCPIVASLFYLMTIIKQVFSTCEA